MKILSIMAHVCALVTIGAELFAEHAMNLQKNIVEKITVQTSTTSFAEQSADAYFFFLHDGLSSEADKKVLATVTSFCPDIDICFSRGNFTGKAGQSFTLATRKNNQFTYFFFLGLGAGTKAWHNELETLRRAVGKAIQLAKQTNSIVSYMTLPDPTTYQLTHHELAKQLTIAAQLAAYEFSVYKKSSSSDWQGNVLFYISAEYEPSVQAGIANGSVIGTATNMSRFWGDLPPNVLTPTILADEAQRIAREHQLTCSVLGRQQALDLGMGAFCAVDAGSAQEGKLVVLEYHCTNPQAPTIAIVGKGVTFDTGGVSLKPATGMTGMKHDMCGAGAVIATMHAIGQCKPTNINVIGLAPLVENMPDGAAARQDDIVTAMNGKTIEIRNTDAEGRLILSDTLCYAERFYQPDIMIDLATLTGACVVAVGHFYTALMTQDEKLFQQLPQIGNLTGDRVWPLPLDDDYKTANASDVAQLGNTGSPAYSAGSIIAGCFLSEFVSKARWAHLDIAGSADNVPGISYLGNGKGTTGAGVRLLCEYLLNHQSYQ